MIERDNSISTIMKFCGNLLFQEEDDERSTHGEDEYSVESGLTIDFDAFCKNIATVNSNVDDAVPPAADEDIRDDLNQQHEADLDAWDSDDDTNEIEVEGESDNDAVSIEDIDEDGELSDEDEDELLDEFSDSSNDSGEDELDEDTLDKIETNDPQVTALAICGFDADMEDAGYHIGQNTQIKKLSIKGQYVDEDAHSGLATMSSNSQRASPLTHQSSI